MSQFGAWGAIRSGEARSHGLQNLCGAAAYPPGQFVLCPARSEDQPDQQAHQNTSEHRCQSISAQQEDLPGRLLGIEQRHHARRIARQQGAIGKQPAEQIAGADAETYPERQAHHHQRQVVAAQHYQHDPEQRADQGTDGAEEALFQQHSAYRLGNGPDGHR